MVLNSTFNFNALCNLCTKWLVVGLSWTSRLFMRKAATQIWTNKLSGVLYSLFSSSVCIYTHKQNLTELCLEIQRALFRNHSELDTSSYELFCKNEWCYHLRKYWSFLLNLPAQNSLLVQSKARKAGRVERMRINITKTSPFLHFTSGISGNINEIACLIFSCFFRNKATVTVHVIYIYFIVEAS
jgi:hypothetical protein